MRCVDDADAVCARSMDRQLVQECSRMKEREKVSIRRRHLLGLAAAGVAAAAGGAAAADRVAPKPADLKATDLKPADPNDKRKARIQPNSPEVRNFYRVNSYPRS